MKNTILFFCISLWSSFSYSQYSISGTIACQDAIYLQNTHIHVGTKTVLARADGSFIANNLVAAQTKIHISYQGYQSIDTVVNIFSNLKLTFRLKPITTNLHEVVILQKNTTTNASVAQTEIKRATIEKFSNQSLGDVLKEVSGVTSLKTGNVVVKPIINGLYGSRVVIINNNIRLEDQQWGVEHAPNFDINTAHKISVIKGASGLQYGGDALGGLVIIEPMFVKKDTLFGKTILNYDSNGKGGSVNSSVHKGNEYGWSYSAQTTLKYSGDKSAAHYILSNTGNREVNFTGMLNYVAKKQDWSGFYSFYKANIGILSASHIGSANDLYQAMQNKQPNTIRDFTYAIQYPKQEVQHQIAKINYHYHFDENSFLALQYAYQNNKRLEFDSRRGDYKNTAALDLSLKTHTLNIDYKKETHDWTLKTGFMAAYQDNYANPATGIDPLIPNYSKIDMGTYAVMCYNFQNDFLIESGLRYDYTGMNASKFYQKSRWAERAYDDQYKHFIVGEEPTKWLTNPVFDFHNLSASFGVHKKTNHNWYWLGNLSFATRNPNPSEFFSDGLHHSAGVIELGDLRLQKEQSTKWSVCLQKKEKEYSFEINPYLNFIKNYIFLTPTGFQSTIRGTFPVWEHQQTNARFFGIDVQAMLDLTSNWQYATTATYIKASDKNKQPIVNMPPLGWNNKVVFSNKKWHNLQLELKSELVFEQNRYPDTNFYTDIVENNALVKVLVDISTPPPAYHLLHFRADMQLKVIKNMQTHLGVSVQNIFDTSYRDYLNRQRLFADELGRSLQIQLKFNY